MKSLHSNQFIPSLPQKNYYSVEGEGGGRREEGGGRREGMNINFISTVVQVLTIPCKASACCLHCGKSHLTYLVSPEVSNANTVLENCVRSSCA